MSGGTHSLRAITVEALSNSLSSGMILLFQMIIGLAARITLSMPNWKPNWKLRASDFQQPVSYTNAPFLVLWLLDRLRFARWKSKANNRKNMFNAVFWQCFNNRNGRLRWNFVVGRTDVISDCLSPPSRTCVSRILAKMRPAPAEVYTNLQVLLNNKV